MSWMVPRGRRWGLVCYLADAVVSSGGDHQLGVWGLGLGRGWGCWFGGMFGCSLLEWSLFFGLYV